VLEIGWNRIGRFPGVDAVVVFEVSQGFVVELIWKSSRKGIVIIAGAD